VVNKADQVALAKRTSVELAAALASLRSAGIASRELPVLATSAMDGTGVEELVAKLEALFEAESASGELVARRREGAIAWGVRAFGGREGEAGLERAGGETVVRQAIAERVDRGEEVIRIVEELGAQ